MSRKNSHLKALASRKQLLIAESELNRAHLGQELQTMADNVQALAKQAKTISLVASTVASLMAGISFLRRKKSAPAGEKPSWWQTILKGTSVVSSLWKTMEK